MELYSITDMEKDLRKHGLVMECEYLRDARVYTIMAHAGIWHATRMISEYTPFSGANTLSIKQHNEERHIAVETIIKEYEHYIQKEKEKEMKNARSEQKFTKDDLKPGYVIKLRNGKYYIIWIVGKETLIATDGNLDWQYLSSAWDDRLDSICRSGKAYPAITHDKMRDIVEVYGYVQGGEYYARGSGEISPDHRPLLWSRQEAKKMTVEEIEKALGYKVEIVSD